MLTALETPGTLSWTDGARPPGPGVGAGNFYRSAGQFCPTPRLLR